MNKEQVTPRTMSELEGEYTKIAQEIRDRVALVTENMNQAVANNDSPALLECIQEVRSFFQSNGNNDFFPNSKGKWTLAVHNTFIKICESPKSPLLNEELLGLVEPKTLLEGLKKAGLAGNRHNLSTLVDYIVPRKQELKLEKREIYGVTTDPFATVFSIAAYNAVQNNNPRCLKILLPHADNEENLLGLAFYKKASELADIIMPKFLEKVKTGDIKPSNMINIIRAAENSETQQQIPALHKCLSEHYERNDWKSYVENRGFAEFTSHAPGH